LREKLNPKVHSWEKEKEKRLACRGEEKKGESHTRDALDEKGNIHDCSLSKRPRLEGEPSQARLKFLPRGEGLSAFRGKWGGAFIFQEGVVIQSQVEERNRKFHMSFFGEGGGKHSNSKRKEKVNA